MSEIAARVRSVRQRWAAPGSSQDRLVTLSRWMLPVLIGALTACLAFMPLQGNGDVSFLLDKNKVAVAAERLRIQSALYRGADRLGRPFSIRAGSAVQQSSDDPVVRLSDLAAQIMLADGLATMRADAGRYNLQAEQVEIDGGVAFRTARGFRLDTHDATVDLRTRTLASRAPVAGRVPQGDFHADRMVADLESHVVRLDGNVRLRIVPGKAR